jgi:hypothetical protein
MAVALTGTERGEVTPSGWRTCYGKEGSGFKHSFRSRQKWTNAGAVASALQLASCSAGGVEEKEEEERLQAAVFRSRQKWTTACAPAGGGVERIGRRGGKRDQA